MCPLTRGPCPRDPHPSHTWTQAHAYYGDVSPVSAVIMTLSPLSEVTPQKAPKNYRETFQAFLFRPSKISRYIQICSQHRLTNERDV